METRNESSEDPNACNTDSATNGAKGGWIATPFIAGTMLGMTIAIGGWYSNLIVFLINQFNIKSIEATQINNLVSGFGSFLPIIGAILADTLWGSYHVALASSFLSLLGIVMFTMTVTISSMKPQTCNYGSSTICEPPTTFQYAFLYAAIIVGSLGVGGTRFVLATMGADQLKKSKHQEMFLAWIIFALYVGWVFNYTFLVYIEDNMSFALGFGISIAANVIAIILFLSGTPFYQRTKPQGSPMTGMARVLVASFRKMKMKMSLQHQKNVHCYHYGNPESKVRYGPPSDSLRFLNRAAIKEGENPQQEAGVTHDTLWRLCSVEEVEDLKKLIKLLPIWSSGILYSVSISIHLSLIVLQALVMDRHIGGHFKIPAGSFIVFSFLVVAIAIPSLDRILFPLWKKVTRQRIRPLQRIGIAHCCNVLGMIVFALVERKRLSIVRANRLMDQPGSVAPMSALSLVLPLAIIGVGEAFQFPGEIALNYQEYPKALKTMSAAMVSLRIAIGFYLSAAFIGILQGTTSWLPNDINHGKVDKVYMVVALVAFLNSLCYLFYASFYKYNNLDLEDDANRH